jgi:hypothetical protein
MMLGAVPLILGALRGPAAPPLVLVGDGAIGAAAYARGSVAYGFGAAGELFAAAGDAPRFVGAESHLLVEREAQNLLPNPRFEGATPGVIGSGGVLPGDCTFTAQAGMTREVVGSGSEDGIPYLDLRLAGTQTNSNAAFFVMGNGSSWACSLGQVFLLSLCTRIVGGSLAGISTFRFRVQERNGTSGTSAQNKLDFTPTGSALRTQRRTTAHTVVNSATNNALFQLGVLPIANQAVNVTFRLGLAQVEAGGVLTSPVLPPAGTQAVSTRAAGSLLHAPAGGLPAAGTLLLDGRLPAAPGVERRLVAVQTAGGGSGVAISTNGAATALSAVPFPSGSAVAGGSVSAGARFRVALAWDSGGIAISVNGGAAASGAAPPPGLAQVSHGGASAAEALEIRRLDLRPQRLSNAELAALTTLT